MESPCLGDFFSDEILGSNDDRQKTFGKINKNKSKNKMRDISGRWFCMHTFNYTINSLGPE